MGQVLSGPASRPHRGLPRGDHSHQGQVAGALPLGCGRRKMEQRSHKNDHHTQPDSPTPVGTMRKERAGGRRPTPPQDGPLCGITVV